jgi:hypothetical protein
MYVTYITFTSGTIKCEVGHNRLLHQPLGCLTSQGKNQPQNSHYDKIIKENLATTLPVIMREILGLEITAIEELPDAIQHMKERKPDALRKVTNSIGNTYILHVEFQLQDEKEMVLRMAEYYIMLLRKYQMPIKQYVIFLQNIYPLMKTSIQNGDLTFKFRLVRIADINYKLFLQAHNPETIILGILGSFCQDDSKTAVNSIVNSVSAKQKVI